MKHSQYLQDLLTSKFNLAKYFDKGIGAYEIGCKEGKNGKRMGDQDKLFCLIDLLCNLCRKLV